MINKNEFEIKGKIINVIKLNNGAGIITLVSKNGRTIYPKVYAVNENVMSQLDKVSLKTHVVVKGYVNSRKVNNIKVQQLVGTSIEPDITICEKEFAESGVKGKFFDTLSTKINLAGEIINLFDKYEYQEILIRTTTPDGYNVTVVVSLKKPSRPIDFKIGQNIFVAASLSTPQKDIDGKTISFENIMALDVAVRD